MPSRFHIAIEDRVPRTATEVNFPPVPAIERVLQRLLTEFLLIEGFLNKGARAPVPLAINLLLLDDPGMAELNAEHRGRASTTDVLSFPLFDWPAGPGTSQFAGQPERFRAILLDDWPLAGEAQAEPVCVGDLVVSVPTCVRQAAEIGHSVGDELSRLLAHGLLHLFGYDHETNAEDEARMRAREDQLLAALDTSPDALA